VIVYQLFISMKLPQRANDSFRR